MTHENAAHVKSNLRPTDVSAFVNFRIFETLTIYALKLHL